MAAPLPDIFGNYALRGIEEITLPATISWLPQTPASGVLLATIALIAVMIAMRFWRRYRSNRYRREALQLVDQWQRNLGLLETVHRLPALIRGVALKAYAREEVASLSGSAWLDFLNGRCGETVFDETQGQILLSAAYQAPEQLGADEASVQALIDDCKRWIRQHRSTG